MTDKEKILANIELLLNEINYEPYTDETFGRIQSLKELKSYIDSLQEEPASEDLEEELNNWRHKHFHGRRNKPASGEYLERISQLDLASHFANLQKQRDIDKACKWLKENIYQRVYKCGNELGFPTAEFLKDFRKAMED